MTEGDSQETRAGGEATVKDADRLAADHTATLDRIAGDLGAVEAAMRRLDEGTYGRCEVCGAEIAEERITSDPLATRCAQHGAGGVRGLEGPVAVLAGDDALALGGEHPEG